MLDLTHPLNMDARQFSRQAAIETSTWPYVALVIFLMPSVYWIVQDHSVWPWDQAWYGEVSANLWFTLLHSPGHWWLEMMRAFGIKAPGIAWVGQWFVPIGRTLGSIELGLLLSVIVVQFGTLTLIYTLSKEFIPDQNLSPLLVSMLVASAPLFIGMSHQYCAEPLQLFAVTYVYWIAARGRNLRRPQVIGHLLLATGLGLASKVTTPIYCFIPGCIAVYDAVTRRDGGGLYQSSLWKRGLLVLAGLAVFGNVVVWYARNGPALLDFVRLASSSEVALDYGRSGSFFFKMQYWLGALQKSVALPTVLFGLAIVLLIGIVSRLMAMACEGWRFLPSRRFTVLAAGAFAHVVLVLTIFSLSINEENRYLLPLLPSLGFIFVWMLSLMKTRFAPALLGLLFIGQWAYVESRALGVVPADNSMSYWVLPMQRSNEAMNELTRVVEMTCTPRTAHRYSVTGVELPWLNANSMSFYAAKWKQESKLQCHNTSLGYAEKDPMLAWKRLDELNIAYFISLEESALPQPPNFLNEVSLSILQKIRADHRFTQLPYDSKLKVVVFRKNEDTTLTH